MPAPSKRTTPKKTDAEKIAAKRAEAIAALKDTDSMSFELCGKTFTVRVNEVSASLSREYRQATGMSVVRTLQMLATEPDPDVWQCLVFLARRQSGEDIALDDIDDYNFADLLTIDIVPVEEDDSPEV